MSKAADLKTQRRALAHAATRGSILEAARRVAARDGSREMSLRGVAAEAGFAPAALYGYFSGKDELLLALAADDLSHLSRAMRDATRGGGPGKLSAAASAALGVLRETESVAAALGALPANGGASEAERLFNGRMIAALKVLSEASGNRAATRDEQCDVVLVAAAVTGLAMLARSGRLAALGFTADEILARLDGRFSP
ncbi:MAG: TetR family transcriptional regulator [Alphaproteobacteria bacterium]|nr:TetR family transcriptional regulator [Alphaproteobacteria bacterium]MBL7096410.1 TetR family transcriptional regulator [Alphaproteobacteria bacterium]